MTKPQCAGVTKQGERCRAFALPGSTYCLTHDPARADEVAAARSRGGIVATKLRALQGRRRRLESAGALTRFMGGLIQDLLDGRVDPDVARAATYAVSVQRQLIEAADHEKRLAELERRYQQAGRPAR